MRNIRRLLAFLIAVVAVSALYLTWRDGFKPGLWILLTGLVFAYLFFRQIQKPNK